MYACLSKHTWLPISDIIASMWFGVNIFFHFHLLLASCSLPSLHRNPFPSAAVFIHLVYLPCVTPRSNNCIRHLDRHRDIHIHGVFLSSVFQKSDHRSRSASGVFSCSDSSFSFSCLCATPWLTLGWRVAWLRRKQCCGERLWPPTGMRRLDQGRYFQIGLGISRLLYEWASRFCMRQQCRKVPFPCPCLWLWPCQGAVSPLDRRGGCLRNSKL